MIYGYVRVSTREQNIDRQMIVLKERGIDKKLIYIDKISGKNFNRPSYQKLIKKLKKNDVIVVKSIDRLGRNYDDILNQWRLITKVKQAHIEVIDFPLLNTNRDEDNLTGIFISDLVLQILAYVAQTEREFIKQRQAEGIAIAKAKGVKFGRNKLELPDNFEEYCIKFLNKELTLNVASQEVGMAKSTFYKKCKEYERNNF